MRHCNRRLIPYPALLLLFPLLPSSPSTSLQRFAAHSTVNLYSIKNNFFVNYSFIVQLDSGTVGQLASRDRTDNSGPAAQFVRQQVRQRMSKARNKYQFIYISHKNCKNTVSERERRGKRESERETRVFIIFLNFIVSLPHLTLHCPLLSPTLSISRFLPTRGINQNSC